MNRTASLLCAAVALTATPAIAGHQHGAAGAATGQAVHAEVIDAGGKNLGMVMLRDTPGGVLVTTDLKGLPPGERGFHFHEKGQCDPAQKFTTAGAHYSAGNPQHGLLTPGGHHGGDMPNAIVAADGTLKVEVLNTGVTLAPGAKSLFDADGSALVIHAKADDYKTQPSGDAGDRIACAVVARPK